MPSPIGPHSYTAQPTAGQNRTGSFSQRVGGGVVTEAKSLVDSAVSWWLNPIKRVSDYWQNAKFPLILPPASLMFDAYAAGLLSDNIGDIPRDQLPGVFDTMQRVLKFQGIPLHLKGVSKESGFEGFAADNINLWHRIKLLSITRPSISDALIGRLKGMHSKEVSDYTIRLNGGVPADWDSVYASMANRLTVDETLINWLRGNIDDDDFQRLLRFNGVVHKLDQDLAKQIAYQLPPVSDVMRMAVREAFNNQQVVALGLDNEYEGNPILQSISEAQGIGWVEYEAERKLIPDIAIDGKAVVEIPPRNPIKRRVKINVPQLYWRMHWDYISISQAMEAVHRLYKISRYGPSPDVLDVQGRVVEDRVYTSVDLNALLKAQDVLPQQRPVLEALSYLPLTRVDTRRMHAMGKLDDAGAYHSFRRQGYNDIDAENLKEFTKELTRQARLKAIAPKAVSAICNSLQIGIIAPEEAANRLVGFGMEKAKADSFVNECRFQGTLQIVKASLSAVKNGFLLGEFTAVVARTTLLSLGFQRFDIERYIRLWTILLSGKRKHVSATVIIDWFIDGIIGIQELNSRLTNLRYPLEEVQRMVQHASLKLEQRTLKLVEQSRDKAEKLAEKQRIAREKATEKVRQAEAKRLSQFLAARSEANLRKWFRAGQIQDTDIRETLRLKGFIEADIDRWLIVERS